MKNPRLTLTQELWGAGKYTDDPLTHVQRAASQLWDVEAALRNRVAEARDAGCTWADIGTALGTTRQAAQQRFN